MLVGPAGTGKTLLCQSLAAYFHDAYQVALLAGGAVGSRRTLLQAVLYELAQPYRGMDEGELRLALIDYLTLSDDCPRGMVLLIDEAHTLPLRLLDEVRALTNLVRGGEMAVHLVLAGSPSLEEHLTSPKLESFNQRLAARCYLVALNGEETQAYIQAGIAAAGGRAASIFPADACQSVYRATDGVPRLINQLCDHAMLMACTAGHRRLSCRQVEEAWADLQQLPTPKSPVSSETSSGVVEFGRLEDDTDERQETDGQGTAPGEEPTLPMLRISPIAEDLVNEAAPAEMQEPAGQLCRIQQLVADAQDESPPERRSRTSARHDDSGPFREAFAEEEVVSDRYARTRTSGARPARACGRTLETCDQVVGEAAAPRQSVQNSDPTEGKPRPAVPEPDDSDLLVVEEGYDDAPPWPVRSIVPVRRKDYASLFARLRRADEAAK
jgi:type II secretory pathway predicted ATPase ExeA